MTEKALERKKLVVVGDGATGKTCMLIRFAEDKFTEEYIPTIFENRAVKINVDGNELELTLWDTAGQEAYEVIRPLAYKDADVVLICYATDSPESLRNVTQMWVEEIRHYCPNTPILLIATKSDLKKAETAVSFEEGKKVGTQVSAREVIECSALENINIQDVFTRAARIALTEKKAKSKGCCTIS